MKIFASKQECRGGGGPELGLRDLATLRSQTFAISSYPFLRYNTVELRYAKLCYGIRYDTIWYVMIRYDMLRYATLYVMICNISIYYFIW